MFGILPRVCYMVEGLAEALRVLFVDAVAM
jgi:hypothetical protein